MTLRMEVTQNKDVWEEFLQRYAPQSLFQSWLWGEVQKKSGETVHRFGLFDQKELVGIAQITVVRAKRGTFLHIRHGPVWKSQTYWGEFVKLIVPMAKKERAWFVRVSPQIDNSQSHRDLFSSVGFTPAAIHEVDAERCWVLDLDKSEDELLMDMRKTTRYEIRQAQKLGVTVVKSSNINTFFELYDKTSERHNFVQHTGIREEWEVFEANLYIARYEKKPLASAIILYYGNQAIYHHGASVPTKIPASYLLQWDAIREAKKRGIKLYNFYGIAPENNPNHPWRGITLFKKGFGGREIEYIHAHDLAVSPLYIIPRTIETIRRLSRGY